jgi:hypothetical protein
MNDVRRRSQPAAIPSLVFLRDCRYCVPKAGVNYKRGKRARKILLARTAAGLRSGRVSFALAGVSFALFAFRDFLSIDSDIAGSLDADSDLRTVHRHHGHLDIIADAQALTSAARKN